MKVRLIRPTRRNKNTGLYNLRIYPLVGTNIARRIARAEALKFKMHVYAHNPATGKMLYLYTDKGELQDFVKERS